MRAPNFLAGLELDREATLRADAEAVELRWKQPQTRVVPVWRSRHLVIPEETAEIVLLGSDLLDKHRSDRVLLGTAGETTFFAVDLSHLEEPTQSLGLEASQRFVGLREAAPLLSRPEGALLAYANGMVSWHRRHRFCGACGAETLSNDGGHVRRCSNEDCEELHFPRTDPAVIMLVTDGDRCLLGRQASWRKPVYSTLAGFVEPGESLEEAVAREVREETSIQVSDVHYHSSQPWPFPSSLMLGFTARAESFDITLQDDELEDARWFTRDTLVAGRDVELPSAISIARRLVEDWIARI
jgi:NAD+ diphosphatase